MKPDNTANQQTTTPTAQKTYFSLETSTSNNPARWRVCAHAHLDIFIGMSSATHSNLVFVTCCGSNGLIHPSVLLYGHDCSGIVKLAAIVWCREDGHHIAICVKLIPVLNHLMSTHNQV